MLTAEMQRQSCLASVERWRHAAEHVREHARRRYLSPQQRETLLAEAEACDRQAAWWLAGADEYVTVPAAERPALSRALVTGAGGVSGR
jgi:hypothetical protein